MRRLRSRIVATKLHNAGNRSGVFALDAGPDDDGIIGRKPYVALWSGVAEASGVTEDTPSDVLLPPFYFEDALPYHWS